MFRSPCAAPPIANGSRLFLHESSLKKLTGRSLNTNRSVRCQPETRSFGPETLLFLFIFLPLVKGRKLRPARPTNKIGKAVAQVRDSGDNGETRQQRVPGDDKLQHRHGE